MPPEPYSFNIKHLSKPPIAEAVIELKVLPADNWNPAGLKKNIEKYLPEFADNMIEGKEVVFQMSFGKEEKKKEKVGCVGYRMKSKDNKYVAQFIQKGFVLVQVKDYESWDVLSEKARCLWEIYVKLLAPKKIKRIGVRFINKLIAQEDPFLLERYYKFPPKESLFGEWELREYFYKERFGVPNTPYSVNVLKTVLPPPKDKTGGIIVLDNDVFLVQDTDCSWSSIVTHLEAMREIKNKAFFGNVNEEKIKEYE